MLTTNKNYLQPTGFKFVIDRRNYPNLEFFAQSVTHPGASVSPLELNVPRVSSIAFAGDKITYSSLTLEVILDEDMESYQEFQNWLERTVNDSQNNSTIDTTPSTSADISLLIMSSHNNKNKQIRYKDCVPTEIGAFTLASNTGDVSYPTFSVTFRFTTFEIT
jgi:hypothetical protein